MTIDLRQILDQVIAESVGVWSEEDRIRATAVVRDAAALALQAAQGANVSAELVHVKAAAANIVGAAELQGREAVRRVLERYLSAARDWLLAGLGF